MGIQAKGVHAVRSTSSATSRKPSGTNGNSVIPPRALHELYLLPFEMSVKDGQMASVMCAFTGINGVSACSNDDLLTRLCASSWGWKGYVITDRRALHDTRIVDQGRCGLGACP